MAYQINKTNGDLLVNLVDGQVNTQTTDISLIGRNYSGFGESINENFVKMLENFTNTQAPATPLTGQLWYDSGEARLKLYDGAQFKSAGGPIVSPTQPQMVTGDLWIDNQNNKLYFYDGTDLVLVGPDFSSSEGTSGFTTETVLDTTQSNRTLVNLNVGGQKEAILSNIRFTPNSANPITGIVGAVEKGINIIDDDFKFHGTATSADTIINAQGVKKNASQFMPTDANATSNGTISTINNGGITVGPEDNINIGIVANQTIIANQVRDRNLDIQVRKASGATSAIKVDTANSYLGIFKASPTATLDVGGSVKIDGDLTVSGNTFSTDVDNLRIKDKNIELAITSDSTVLPDADVNDAGIIVKANPDDKEFIWKLATNAFTSNVFFDSSAGYKINGNTVISGTTLGTITSAPQMQTLGTLTALGVDNVEVDGQKVSSNVGNLQLEAATGVIEILNTNKISGLGEPVAGSDAATKNYVDTAIDGEGVAMALDITGMGYNPGAGGGAPFGAKLVTLLEEIVPSSTKVNGTQAKIHATDQTSASATLTASALNTGLDESTVAVDKTVTVATRTVASITKGTLTILTLDAVHGYDAGRNVTISGALGVTAINGTYAINRIVSSTEIEINLDTSSEVGTYTADSASVSRVTETGQENETVLKDVQFSDVTGSVSLTVNRYVLTCTVTAGAWVYTSGVSSTV
tara:strand:- start:2251 stop:4335 length:2085 start_codon:yes stop_codon:yes gene_type:complete